MAGEIVQSQSRDHGRAGRSLQPFNLAPTDLSLSLVSCRSRPTALKLNEAPFEQQAQQVLDNVAHVR